MKRIFLVVITVMTSFILNAQEDKEEDEIWINRDFAAQLNAIFGDLERDRIPYGVLYDYALPLVDLQAYNGVLTDSTLIDLGVMSDIYKTLQLARIHPKSEKDFIDEEDWAKRWAGYRKQQNDEKELTTIVLSGLHYRYAALPQQSFEQGKIKEVNGVLQDVYINGQWQNPYVEKRTSAISPPLSEWNSSRFEVVLPSDLFLTNTERLAMMTVDFGDGLGQQPLDLDRPIRVDYQDEGTYQWTFTFLDAEQSSTVAVPIHISNTSLSTITEDRRVHIPNGSHGAVLNIKYAAKHHKQLKKPLIIAEGFDPESVLYPEKRGGGSTLKHFIESLSKAEISLLSLLKGDSSEYDLVYIDWDNGIGDIRKNAETLEKVIDWVNAEKSRNHSIEPNVLLGQSMGGLIGRYALATMEKNAREHQVRLFVAHDSPFQGANTPVSAQFFIRHVFSVYLSNPVAATLGEVLVPFIQGLSGLMGSSLLSDYVSPGQAVGIQDSPAALQMTKYHVTPRSQVTSQFHDVWQAELDRVGYPKQSRNIAISNGNMCGIGQGFQGGDALYYYDETFRTKDVLTNFLADMGLAIWGYTAGKRGLGFISTIPGKAKIDYLADLRSIPEQGADDRIVYRGKMRYHKKLWSLFGWKPTISTDVIPLRVNEVNKGFLPLETFAGGVNSLKGIADNSISVPAKGFVNPDYGFVSVISALDISRNHAPLNVYDYRRDFNFEGFNDYFYNTPFENFITEKTIGKTDNFSHISFSSRIGNWLAQELEGEIGAAVDCNFVCEGKAPITIMGHGPICVSAEFSAPALADNYYWSIVMGADLVRIVENGNREVTLTKRNSFTDKRGVVSLQLDTYSFECGHQTFTKDIWFGKPDVSIWSDRQDSYVDVVLKAAQGDLAMQGIYEFEWERLPKYYPGGENVSFSGNYLKGKATGPRSRWALDVQVSVRNNCGVSKTTATLFSEIKDDSGEAYECIFELMPVEETENTYEVVRVEIIEEIIKYVPLLPEDRVEIRAYNMSGQNLLRTIENRIDLSNLENGIYILNALINEREKIELKVYKK